VLKFDSLGKVEESACFYLVPALQRFTLVVLFLQAGDGRIVAPPLWAILCPSSPLRMSESSCACKRPKGKMRTVRKPGQTFRTTGRCPIAPFVASNRTTASSVVSLSSLTIQTAGPSKFRTVPALQRFQTVLQLLRQLPVSMEPISSPPSCDCSSAACSASVNRRTGLRGHVAFLRPIAPTSFHGSAVALAALRICADRRLSICANLFQTSDCLISHL
jgi:hypothetical protein